MIIGKRNASAIGTLVERATGYTMLVHLPAGYKPEQVAPALAAKIQTLPRSLRGSLTWDQGAETRDWKQVTVAADIAIFFCDPHSPWQRGTNENTNGLLRQYFPKGTDPVRAQRRRPGLGSRRAQRPTPQTSRVSGSRSSFG
ncbi:MAG: IS30 family transposase [Nocardioidaceae bacterium]